MVSCRARIGWSVYYLSASKKPVGHQQRNRGKRSKLARMENASLRSFRCRTKTGNLLAICRESSSLRWGRVQKGRKITLKMGEKRNRVAIIKIINEIHALPSRDLR